MEATCVVDHFSSCSSCSYGSDVFGTLIAFFLVLFELSVFFVLCNELNTCDEKNVKLLMRL